MTDHYLPSVDPRIGTSPLSTAKVAWVIRVLTRVEGRPVAQTIFVDDITGEAFAARSNGIVAVATDRPAPSPVGFPGAVFGLQVLSVEEVIAAGVHPEQVVPDQAYAVRGYYIVPPPEVSCLLGPIPGIPGNTRCGERARLWLLGDPETPWKVVNLAGQWRPPRRPALTSRSIRASRSIFRLTTRRPAIDG
jgi:hypothetical protein